MIEFTGTIGIEPRWFGYPVTKPGHGEPEPVKPVPTMDTPENVAACLSCHLPTCRSEHPTCPLYGYSAKAKRARGKKIQTRAERIAERDNKIRDLLNAGWVNQEAICEELNIGKSSFFNSKRRLKERGEI